MKGAMPWSAFMLTVLFGVIYGNRLLDNRYQRLSAPYAENVKNSDAQRVALLEGITNENSIFEASEDNEATYKPTYPCQQPNEMERYYGFIDCVFKNGMDSSDIRGKQKYGKKNKNFNVNPRDFVVSLDSRTGYDFVNDLSEELKIENSKSDTADTTLVDPNDIEVLHASLPSISSSNIVDFYEDLLEDAKELDKKRGGSVSAIGCDCKIKNDLLDLGQRHFPRYLLNAVCQSDINPSKCWRGICKPLEYKVKVLTLRGSTDHSQKDPALAWLPDDLRQLWKFKTVTVAAGCFCAIG